MTTHPVINIGPGERRKRAVMGAAMLAVAVGIFLALMVTDAGRWWRIVVFVPVWIGALGFFQARANT